MPGEKGEVPGSQYEQLDKGEAFTELESGEKSRNMGETLVNEKNQELHFIW